MKNLYLPQSINWRRAAFLAFIFCSIGSLLLSIFVLTAATPFAAAAPSPEQYMEEGLRSFQHGDFHQAVLQWSEAARIYEKEGNPDRQTEALTRLSQAYQSAGHYEKAREHLEDALVLAKESGDQTSIARVLGRLGDAHLATGPEEKAHRYLTESLGIARKLGDPELRNLSMKMRHLH
jgi:tetratricopeptide (TPR) repeat protein